ncbi:MAG: c-type cytochrome [Burkholderiaceae bacterium]|jgi:cytochrome c5|nr:c-type cytochrome [Burkholderiaceae bacterium]
MSDSAHQPASGASAGAPNTFLIGAAVFVVAVVLAIGMWIASTAGSRAAVAASGQDQNIAEQLQKIGSFDINLMARAADSPPRSGEDVYKAVCSACHATGVTGAPKLGDAADWGPRLAQGQQTLEQAPIKGFTGQKGTMPSQSGGQYTDYEIIRAVVYMANAGGAKFEEPVAPADAASAEEAAK